MKVILIQDVPGLGNVGDTKEVAPGYARNYLFKKQLAVPATPGALVRLQTEQKAQEERDLRITERAAELAERMAEVTLTFEAKAGPTGRLYGSITTAQIAEALEQELGVSFDRRQVLGDPLREVGEHIVPIRVARNTEAHVRTVIRAEGEEPLSEQPEEPEAPEPEA